MNCRKFAVILLVVVIVVIPTVMAVGIAPGLREVVYEPNKDVPVQFWATSAGSGDNAPVEITVSGYMAPYMEPNITAFQVDEGEHVPFTIIMHFPSPDDIRPEKHRNKVIVTETDTPGGTVGGVASVAGYLDVIVPKGDYYVELDLIAPDTQIGEPVPFGVQLNSYGRKITDVSGKIEIYEFGKTEVLDVIPIETVSLRPGEKKLLNVEWTPDGLSAGDYSAAAIINYKSITRNSIKKFRLGDVNAEIWNIEGQTIKRGDVGKITFHLRSFWMEPIDAVSGEVRIRLSDDKMESITTNSITMQPEKHPNNVLYTYWNSKDIRVGNYNATISLRYGDKLTTHDFQIQVIEGGGSFPWKFIVIGLIISAAAIGGAYYFIQHKKKLEEELKRLEEEEKRKLEEEERRLQEEQRRLQEEARRKYEQWRQWWEYYYGRGNQ